MCIHKAASRETHALFVPLALSPMLYMAGNIGREFYLVDLRMSGWFAKFKSAKYSANMDFVDLVYGYAVPIPSPAHAKIMAPPIHQIKMRLSSKMKKNDK